VPWFRVDDTFHSHPKILAAGNEATGLYVRCGSYAAQHLTDGYIPEHIAELYGACDTGSRRNPDTGKPETLGETLVRAKLWRRTRGGYKMPGYLDYNPSKTAVENQRKEAAERQRRRREGLLSQRDSRVSHRTPALTPITKDEASTTAARPRPVDKPSLASSNGSAATRQPPPYAQAVHHALNPEDPT